MFSSPLNNYYKLLSNLINFTDDSKFSITKEIISALMMLHMPKILSLHFVRSRLFIPIYVLMDENALS